MSSNPARSRTTFPRLVLLAILSLAATLGACGRSTSSLAPANLREEATTFAKGGVKGKPAAPVAPSTLSPTDGALEVARPVSLSWTAVAGASSYGVQVSTSSTFASTVVNTTGLSGTSFVANGLAASTTYFWRVNARNAGGTSAFSAASSFTTAAAPIVQAPAAPALLSPANGATGVSVAPSLSWSPSTGATSYRVQVATDAGFSALVNDLPGLTATSVALSGLANNTLYFWRVNASNSGGTSAFSGAFSFTTAAIAPPPGDPCGSLQGLGGPVVNEVAEVVQFRPGNRLRIEVIGDVTAGTIDALGACSTSEPQVVTWPGGTANVRLAGTNTSISGALTFGELLFPGVLLEPGIVVADDAVGNVLEIIWPEISGIGVGAPILRLQLAQWDPSVDSGTSLDVVMTFVARAADGTTATFQVDARGLIVP